MGEIIKTDAEIVQKEKEIKQLKSEISNLNNKLSELVKDLNYARLFDDAEEEEIIRAEKDDIVEQRNKLYDKLEGVE